MPPQLRRLIPMFAVFIALFLLVRHFLVPDSFGEYGFYRVTGLPKNGAPILPAMQTGQGRYGMQTFNQSLLTLYQQKLIDQYPASSQRYLIFSTKISAGSARHGRRPARREPGARRRPAAGRRSPSASSAPPSCSAVPLPRLAFPTSRFASAGDDARRAGR